MITTKPPEPRSSRRRRPRAARKLDPRPPAARDVQHRATRQRPAADGLVRRGRRGQRGLRARRRGLGPAARPARRPIRSDEGARRPARPCPRSCSSPPGSRPRALRRRLWWHSPPSPGSSAPPLDACVRTLLPGMVADPSRLPALFAFESTVLEITFVLGPPLALGVGAIWSTGAALAFAGDRDARGDASRSRLSRHRGRGAPSRALPRRRGGSLRSPAIVALVLIEVGTGAVFGATEVGVTAAAKALGSTAAAGPAARGVGRSGRCSAGSPPPVSAAARGVRSA